MFIMVFRCDSDVVVNADLAKLTDEPKEFGNTTFNMLFVNP